MKRARKLGGQEAGRLGQRNGEIEETCKMKLRAFPRNKEFSASAPCRIDSGGTWDIKAMALPYELVSPTTVNIALNMRTTVTLSPFEKGRIRISSEGFSKAEEYNAICPALTGRFAIFAAAVRHAGLHGLKLKIKSDAPVRSAMGGSSTALVAAIKALSKALSYLEGRPLTKKQILYLSYHIEDAVSGGGCGMQDHGAAVYGGVNQWLWRYSKASSPYLRKRIGNSSLDRALSQRLLVAYSGKTHSSTAINRKWLSDFLSGKTTMGWIEANKMAHRFARALDVGDWDECAKCIRKEMAIRMEITPEAVVPETSLLIEQAESAGCGARFAGAGAGGVVWAIGPKEKIGQVKRMWQDTLKTIKSGKLLTCQVDDTGAI